MKAIDATVVAALARLQGLGELEANVAARIAVGAGNAVDAVVGAVQASLFDTEPSGFDIALERLADASLPPSRTPAVLPSGAKATDPLNRTLVEIAADLATGAISSVELTRAALARAEQAQRILNCFIAIEHDPALAAAAAADAARARGALMGPLHGIPLAHKDMYYTAGRVTECGSRVRRGFVPKVTASVIERMVSAGAVTLGRLNMTEFALGPTGHNAWWGDCRNPWNPAHIAAGSSSGSGAAVAARVAFASLGSDTGGSTRLPACVNGLVGLKPTYSLISRFGAMNLSYSADTPGPLARTAADLARLLEVLAGHDPRDPTSSRRAVPSYSAALGSNMEGLRIGVPKNYFFDHVTADVGAALDEALRVFRTSGASIVEVHVPHAEHLSELSRALVYPEATALHLYELQRRPGEFSPQVRVRASTGLAIPAPAHLAALQVRATLLESFVAQSLGSCDMLFAPTLSIPVPTLEETGVGGGEAMWRIIAQLVHCTAPFNYLGVPALSVPAGFAKNGLPVGFQLVGRPFSEARLLAAAHAYQCATDWHQRAPTLRG